MKDSNVDECKEDEFASKLNIMLEKNELLCKKHQEKESKKLDNARRMKKRMNKIAEITKNIIVFVCLCLLVSIVFIATNALTDLLVWILHFTIDWNNFLYRLSIIGILFVCTILMICITTFFTKYGETWRKEKNKNVFKWIVVILWYPIYFITNYIFIKFIWRLLICTIIFGVCEGIIEGFNEFGGIFADYFNASYSDYCPGINWEKEE